MIESYNLNINNKKTHDCQIVIELNFYVVRKNGFYEALNNNEQDVDNS